jgi:hypothetical protein
LTPIGQAREEEKKKKKKKIAAFSPMEQRDATPNQIDETGASSEDSLARRGTQNRPKAPFTSSNARIFQFKKQTHKLFSKQIFRWIGTAILISSILVTIKSYESKGNITSAEKATFNVTVTALSLGLGLNFFVRHHARAHSRPRI